MYRNIKDTFYDEYNFPQVLWFSKHLNKREQILHNFDTMDMFCNMFLYYLCILCFVHDSKKCFLLDIETNAFLNSIWECDVKVHDT